MEWFSTQNIICTISYVLLILLFLIYFKSTITNKLNIFNTKIYVNIEYVHIWHMRIWKKLNLVFIIVFCILMYLWDCEVNSKYNVWNKSAYILLFMITKNKAVCSNKFKLRYTSNGLLQLALLSTNVYTNCKIMHFF